eukprot:COSAG06_NODE_540_length_14473_cov_34.614164_4_plen_229_part_00
MVGHRQQPDVVGPELRPLHVDELLGRQQVRVVQQLRRWCGEVKVRDFGGECWKLVIPSAAYRLLLQTPSPARPAGAQLLAKDRKHDENHLPPPPASRCASSSSRERERVDACAHTQARPTHPGPRAPHRWQVLMEWRRQQPPVVEAELHLLHVDDLLQPPVAPQRAALAAGWRGERAGLRRRVPEASASSDGLPTPAPSAVPFPSSLSAVTQAHPARGSDERPCVPRR